MPLKAGTVADFSNSMAEAIETALMTEYQNVKGEAMPDMGVEDRRLLLVAIAQGVVRHLKDNSDALLISVETAQVTGEPGAPLLRSENPAVINVTGGGNIGAGNADVTQIDAANNRILTRGTAVVDDIATTGALH